MHSHSLSRSSGWFFSFLASFAFTAARAQTSDTALVPESVELDRFIVSASRTPQDPVHTPSSVSVLDLRELGEVQISDLHSAIAQEPGVVVVRTGSAGGPASIFMRGSNGDHTLFMVDGIRMNDRAALYVTYLGSADLANLSRIEVLRGPQSTLYGSAAMGGVITLDSARGSGPFSGVVSATGGSFDSWGASAAVAGSEGGFSYSGSFGRRVTANDVPANDLRQWTYATRLEYTPVSPLTLGFTFRAQNDEYEQTGSRFFYAPGEVTNDNDLTTVYAEVRVSETLTSRLTLGHHRRHYTFTDQWGVSDTKNRRNVADWQTTWQAHPDVELVGGVNSERSRYTVDGARSKDEVHAAYLAGTWQALDTVTLTAGARYDDFASVGEATTWRTGASWRPVSGTKLRATYGTGFSAPGSNDRYGVPQWGQLPNPNLQPEKSRGWDVGIDQEFLAGRATLELTYFQNRFRNLFEWEYVDLTTYQGWTANRARARTEGVEVAVRAEITATLQARLSYTYLDAENTGTGARLIRRPRHVVDAELRAEPAEGWIIGAGLHGVSDRVETAGPLEDYTTVRVFSSVALPHGILLKLRVENALDEAYEEVLGYASLPRGVFGAVEWRF